METGAIGNPATAGSAGYGYDYEGRALSASSALDPAANLTAAYDWSGRRVSKTEGGATTLYPFGDYEVRGASTLKHYSGAGKKLAERTGAGSGTIHFFLTDHLGSSTAVVSSTGATEADQSYYAWGELIPPSTPPTYDPHYKFTGKERDKVGLDYFGARSYDSALSLFTSPDPIILASDQAELRTAPAGSKLIAKDDAPPKEEKHDLFSGPSAQTGPMYYGGTNYDVGLGSAAPAAGGFLADPLRLLPYTYTSNNPVKYVDLDGRRLACGGYAASRCDDGSYVNPAGVEVIPGQSVGPASGHFFAARHDPGGGPAARIHGAAGSHSPQWSDARPSGYRIQGTVTLPTGYDPGVPFIDQRWTYDATVRPAWLLWGVYTGVEGLGPIVLGFNVIYRAPALGAVAGAEFGPYGVIAGAAAGTVAGGVVGGGLIAGGGSIWYWETGPALAEGLQVNRLEVTD